MDTPIKQYNAGYVTWLKKMVRDGFSKEKLHSNFIEFWLGIWAFLRSIFIVFMYVFSPIVFPIATFFIMTLKKSELRDRYGLSNLKPEEGSRDHGPNT